MDSSSDSEDLAYQEELDIIDPLRHLRKTHDEDDEHNAASDTILIPSQPPSVHNQITTLSFPVSDHDEKAALSVRLEVDASPGCGGIAWPAGEVLSRYIAKRGSLSGKTVVELGSGTGLVGLVAGILGARVWITDQAPLLDIMQRNVDLNGLGNLVSVLELNWGEALPKSLPSHPDLVLAADCVYFEPAFPLLVKTLSELVIDSAKTESLFCYKKRRKADKRFFTLLKKQFDWLQVGDPSYAEYSRDAISLLRLAKK